MDQGLGLSYRPDQAKQIIDYLLHKDQDIHLHGMNFNNLKKLTQEKENFINFTGINNPGIRFHYLRKDNWTNSILDQVGFKFDSSEMAIKSSYTLGKIHKIPISIMDSGILSMDASSPKAAIEYTKKLISKAESAQLDYFVINFHDLYFSKIFKSYYDWYCWLIDYLFGHGLEFTTFNTEINIKCQRNY